MSKTIEISRELLEQVHKELTSGAVSIGTGAKVRALLAAPVVERQEPVAWSSEKPCVPGAYWIRGFNLSGEFNQSALVQVVLDEDEKVLMVNLHQSTTETDTGYWYEVDDISEDFEWLGPLYTSPPAPVAVVLPDRGGLSNRPNFNEGWNACLDKVKELNQ